MAEFVSLDQAIERHVQLGDAVHVIMGHSRWTALVRELARQHWHRDSGLTLMMASLSSLGTLLFRAGCVRHVVTAYSGDSFPTYTPNPVYQEAYRSGAVTVEHWSFLAYVQRLTAAAQGLPAAVTGSIVGSSMADNAAHTEVETALGRVSLLAPLVPDVTLVHAAVADRAGNIAMAPPLLEGVAGAWAARRGVVASVDAVVDDLTPWNGLVRIPAHRVLAVVEAPFGAHPGGLWTGGLPAVSYGEDVPFWTEARDATRSDDLDSWIREWCLDLPTHAAYLSRLGEPRLEALRRRAEPDSWTLDDEEFPIDRQLPVTESERMAVWTASVLAGRVRAVEAHAVLAGAGLANLAAWLGANRARSNGSEVVLTAELGMWDYAPTPADPFIFNFRSFPGAGALADANHVLGTVIGGPATRTIACVGAAQFDRFGNLNSTDVPNGPFLVGSGGGNDVVTRADETVVVSPMRRSVDELGYVTAPGDRVSHVVTDVGVLRRIDDDLVLTAVPAGDTADGVARASGACGWPLHVARQVETLADVAIADVVTLRNWDRRGFFLGR